MPEALEDPYIPKLRRSPLADKSAPAGQTSRVNGTGLSRELLLEHHLVVPVVS